MLLPFHSFVTNRRFGPFCTRFAGLIFHHRINGMSSRKITIKVNPAFEAAISSAAKQRGVNTSKFIRDAVRDKLASTNRAASVGSVYVIAQRSGFLGAFTGLPGDLSTNKKHFEGFGK